MFRYSAFRICVITVAPLPPMFCAMPVRGTVHLGLPTLTPELLNNFHDLVHAGGAHRMAACFQSAPRANGNAARGTNDVLEPQPHTLAALGEAASLER